MKTRTKALLLAMCAVLLVVTTVMATLAFLTSQTEVVKNTFTVGNVVILLDEKDTDGSNTLLGEVSSEGRDHGNLYHLLPNKSYEKDPTVFVKANSEDCYLFIKVTNNIAAIEDKDATIAAQIAANGWIAHPTVEGVYYRAKVTKSSSVQPFVVFNSFKIAQDVSNDTLAAYVTANDATKVIEIQAYAIQSEGFSSALNAWENAPLAAWN